MSTATGNEILETRIVRRLELEHDGSGPKHLSAASGLVRVGQRLFVVADDENSLGIFDLGSDGHGLLFELLAGRLPPRRKERKAAKPDFEALAVLPPDVKRPFGALLALGSGSRSNRQLGVLVMLGGDDMPQGGAQVVDMVPLFASLHEHFTDLNVEGAFVEGGDLCLLQRGNERSPPSACIRFVLLDVERWLDGSALAPVPRVISYINLGDIDGIPLCLTDGAAMAGGGWAFCAAAEDTTDSYRDGRCLGSVVGLVSDEKVVRMKRLGRVCKTEGIAIREDSAGIEVLLVTDDDDRSVPALLLSATLGG